MTQKLKESVTCTNGFNSMNHINNKEDGYNNNQKGNKKTNEFVQPMVIGGNVNYDQNPEIYNNKPPEKIKPTSYQKNYINNQVQIAKRNKDSTREGLKKAKNISSNIPPSYSRINEVKKKSNVAPMPKNPPPAQKVSKPIKKQDEANLKTGAQKKTGMIQVNAKFNMADLLSDD